MVLCKLSYLILDIYFKILTFLTSKPQCRYGPHNPAIDVGCANCGFIPNYRSQAQAFEKLQSIADFTGQTCLASHLSIPIVLTAVPSKNSKYDWFSESFGPEHFPANSIEANLANRS